mmetsp:Transcript_15340/g.27249  ORF Transcript_15340/g.27249 Transcript_15340/m.27249 type:complete len:81 (-) Transcript_15340:92-334(-)
MGLCLEMLRTQWNPFPQLNDKVAKSAIYKCCRSPHSLTVTNQAQLHYREATSANLPTQNEYRSPGLPCTLLEPTSPIHSI